MRILSRLRLHRFLLGALAMLPFVAGAGQGAVGNSIVTATAISWSVNSGLEQVHLVVTGPGGRVEKTSAGGGIDFSVSDLPDGAVDGAYQYRLQAAPSGTAQLVEQIDQAEADENNGTMEQLTAELDDNYQPVVESGSFSLADGLINTGDGDDE